MTNLETGAGWWNYWDQSFCIFLDFFYIFYFISFGLSLPEQTFVTFISLYERCCCWVTLNLGQRILMRVLDIFGWCYVKKNKWTYQHNEGVIVALRKGV